MLTLKDLGLTLEPLTPETAEVVRKWRNREDIAQFMEYREFISEEMQQQWFLKVEADPSSIYWLIRNEKESIGLIHLAEIDLVAKTAHSGLFVGNVQFIGTGIALGASLIVLDYAFEKLGLQEVFAKVKNGNREAEKYNELLGFKREKELNGEFNLWKVTRADYQQRKKVLIELVK